MIKRFVVSCFVVMIIYLLFLFLRLQNSDTVDRGGQTGTTENSLQQSAEHHKVYSFSFSKYTPEGDKELEIEGDSADIFAKVVSLKNVIAKAYANEKPVIGFVGSLVGQKGINHLLHAVRDLNCKLLIVGDGPEKEKLFRLSKEIQIDVQFEPAATHKQVAAYMQQMDIFVLPSLTRPNWVEKFGRVLIEAMACGVPVVGSNSGEIPNVIGEAGLIFKEGDRVDLRDKLDLLLNDKNLRDRFGELGRERSVIDYSWKSIANQTISIYKQLSDIPS